MQEQPWQIGICGTFDVANYGDLLFPLIAESELTERLGALRGGGAAQCCVVVN
jgi:lipopolysaccharide transport system ATP-binding protein